MGNEGMEMNFVTDCPIHTHINRTQIVGAVICMALSLKNAGNKLFGLLAQSLAESHVTVTVSLEITLADVRSNLEGISKNLIMFIQVHFGFLNMKPFCGSQNFLRQQGVLPRSAFELPAPPSVCVPAVLGALAVWIQNPKKKQQGDVS